MPPEKSCRRQLLCCCSILLEIFATVLAWSHAATALKFDFSSLKLGDLKLLGDAHLKNGSIRLSRDLPVPNSGAGRALFSEPVRIRHPVNGTAIPFLSFFSFHVVNLNPSSIGGGLTFLLTSDDRAIGDPGGYLGLIGPPSAANPSLVAVEFDTLMDVEFEDINGNHVGVDLDSMVSAQVADLDTAGIDLKSGKLINAWIEYDDQGVLRVFVSYSSVQPEKPVLVYTLDLAQIAVEFMFVGFSGSTQGSTEIHSIEWWSFSSSSSTPPISNFPSLTPRPPSSAFPKISGLPPPTTAAVAPSISVAVAEGPSNGSNKLTSSSSSCHSVCRQGRAAVIGVAGASAFFITACATLSVWAFTRRAKSIKNCDALAAATDIVKSPREFTYRELVTATHGFNPGRIIGHGAFGTVYKGIIPETGVMVAVKRCTDCGGGRAAAQGKEEFLSELSIIASLRHRNLVRLQGWCQEKGEVLLVYDYMRHGSLDKALFDSSAPLLQWRHRRKILAGVAAAVAYLHHECERQVIHRDVKSSNVMLDENFHPRLGDFGLARQVDHDHSPDATVTAGTMGYLAPEYILTGRASDKTDVFSFGALVLEVVSGRRPIDDRRRVSLVEWVWGLHGEGKLLEAVDSRLVLGECEDGEMRRVLLVGLGCSSPDPVLRPGMRAVVQMLNGEAEPPNVPTAKPFMSLSTNHQLLLNLQDSISDFNAIGLDLYSSSSSSSPLTSLLRNGGGGGGNGHPAAGD